MAPNDSRSGRAPPGDWNSIAADATRLSDDKFLRIYHLLEQVADNPQVRSAFDALRPRLVELRPPRRPSLSRLFFRPVEDLLDDPMTYARRLNRVSRSTLPPCWRAIADRLDPALVGHVQTGIQQTDPHDGAGLAKVAAPLWRRGAHTLAEVLAECGRNLKTQVSLFGRDEDVVRQVDTIRQVLEIGPEVEELKQSLPERPIGELAESHVDAIKTTLADLGRDDARYAAPALMVLTARMKRPGDLLRLLGEVKLAGSREEKEGLTRELSGYVVGNLVRQAGDMDKMQPASGEAGEMALLAERVTEGLNSVTDTLQALRDTPMLARVQGARQEMGQAVLRTVVADLDRTLIDTLFPVDGRTLASDAEVRKAEQMALALRRSAKLGPHLGIQREVNSKINEVRRRLEGETEALLRDSRGSGGQTDPQAKRQVFNSLRMIEILAGSDEAERLYRDWKRRMG